MSYTLGAKFVFDISDAKKKLNEMKAGVSNFVKGFTNNMKNTENVSFSKLNANLQAELQKTAIETRSSLSDITKTFENLNINFGAMNSNELIDNFIKVKNELSTIPEEIKKMENEIKSLNKESEQFQIEIDTLSQKYKGLSSSEWLNADKIAFESLNQKIRDNNTLVGINEIHIKTLQDRFKDLQVNLAATNAEMKNVNQTSTENSKKGIDISNSFKKGFSSLKRFTLGLIGVRSAYGFLRSAVSEQINSNAALEGSFAAIKASIGQAILPLAQMLINAFVGFVPYIIMAINYVYAFINALFGTKLQLIRSISPIKKQTKAIRGQAKAVRDLNKELGGLSGFDEIHQIQTESDSNGGGSSPDVPQDTSGIDQINSKLQEMMKGVTNSGDLFRKFVEGIKKHWKEITIGLLIVGGIFLLPKLFKALFATKPAAGLNQIGEALKGFATLAGVALVIGSIALVFFSLTGLIKEFAASGKSAWEVGGLIAAIFASLTIATVIMENAFQNLNMTSIAGLLVVLGGMALVLTTISNLITAVGNSGMSTGEVIGLLVTVFGSMAAIMGVVALLGPSMAAGMIPFAVVMGVVMGFLLVLSVTLPPILKALKDFFTAIGPIMVQILDKIYLIICRLFDSLDNLVNQLLAPVLVPLFKNIGNIIKDLVKGIGFLIGKIGEFFNSVKNNVIGVFTKGGQIFKGIVDGIVGVFKWIINGIIDGINAVISAPFKFINGILTKIKNIKILNMQPFGFINTLPVPKIPRLAKGGVATRATLAEIGEGRYKEAVVPLENSPQFRDMKREIVEGVVEGIGNTQTGNGIKKLEIDFLAGGIRVGKQFIDLIERTKEAYGID